MGVEKTPRKPDFTLKHSDRRNQVGHTGDTFTMKISVEKTKAGNSPRVGKIIKFTLIKLLEA